MRTKAVSKTRCSDFYARMHRSRCCCTQGTTPTSDTVAWKYNGPMISLPVIGNGSEAMSEPYLNRCQGKFSHFRSASPLITNRSPTYLGSALPICGRFTTNGPLPTLASVIRRLRCREFCRSFYIEQFGVRQQDLLLTASAGGRVRLRVCRARRLLPGSTASETLWRGPCWWVQGPLRMMQCVRCLAGQIFPVARLSVGRYM
jgi:hypothetical protein